jgi:hypothetical protein
VLIHDFLIGYRGNASRLNNNNGDA